MEVYDRHLQKKLLPAAFLIKMLQTQRSFPFYLPFSQPGSLSYLHERATEPANWALAMVRVGLKSGQLGRRCVDHSNRFPANFRSFWRNLLNQCAHMVPRLRRISATTASSSPRTVKPTPLPNTNLVPHPHPLGPARLVASCREPPSTRFCPLARLQ